jgi:hypothetical protein
MSSSASSLADRLARLANHHTRYELIAVSPEGRRVLLGYTARRSRSGLRAMLRQNAPSVVAVCGSDSFGLAKRAADGATVGAWRVVFSGRTQREAIIAGELPFVVRVASA